MTTPRIPSLPVDLTPLAEVWTSGALIAGGGTDASPFADLTSRETLRIIRTSAPDTYAFEIDWSRDGATVDVTEVIAVANNARASVTVGARFARFRVRNTSATVALTAHRTTVSAR